MIVSAGSDRAFSAQGRARTLSYGDDLDILRRYIPDESGSESDTQLVAFEGASHWGADTERVYDCLTNASRHEGRVPDNVSTITAALRHDIGENQMMAYLVEMAAA
ncbi:MAG: hypothetical protein C0418_03595 [Coriobacteriaceae bacterium]|nr:hypothetical protein [Coriobacteriaceae bacterium]